MFLKSYTGLSDDGLIEMFNGSIHMQMFCGVLIAPSCPIKDGKIVSVKRNRLGRILDINSFQSILYAKWQDCLKDKDLCLTDATCYENYLRFPTDIKLLWECCHWLHTLLVSECKHLSERILRSKYETSAKPLLQFVFLKYSLCLYRMKQKLSSPSFADLFLGQRKVKQTFFSQINTIIDWGPIRAIIEVAYTKGYKSTGRPSYDSLVLFKIELLRTWYGLSDGEVEEQVNDRLSFSRFAGLGMEDIIPDSTTVCRFRKILVEADLYDTLLAEFNRQLEAKGIIVKRGAIVDASITNTPCRPRGGKSYEVVEDRKEDENMEASEKAMLKEVVKPNVDTEARWVKKMGKLHFGYKRHTVTDENGLVLAEETTAANESDMKHLETPLKKAKLPRKALVYADKGYDMVLE